MDRSVVLVTGASGGIGGAVCRAFAGRGAHVVLLGRSPDRLAAVAREVREAGGTADVVVADVTDRARVDAAVEDVAAAQGRLDVVVHAAAVAGYGRLDQVPPEVWDRVVTVGVTGTANVARAAVRRFRAQGGGSLVVVGSVLGQVTVPYMGAYVTGKWANEALARVLQQENRDVRGLHVAVVHPGAVRTPIYPLAANYAGRQGKAPPPVGSADRVARDVLTAVDHRRRKVRAGRANALMRLGFGVTPRLYDVLAGPLMRTVGMSRRIAPHDGNAFLATQDVQRLRGAADPAQTPDPLAR